MSTYVYGIARGDHPGPPEGVNGVGDPPAPVRTLRAGELAAVVSDCPGQLRPKRRDLLAHQHVLAEAGAAGSVLPLRFGSVSEDDDVVRGVLEDHGEHYRGQLDRLDGRVEYNVKAVHREEEVLRQVVADDAEVRALQAANKASGGGSYQDRLRLGELVANGVRAREVHDAKAVEAALAPLSEQQNPGPESAGWLVNLSFLMRRDATAPFVNAIEEFQQANPHLEVQVTGPLPPYSFVEPAPAHA
ncbi:MULTISPECIES: GvpL/GvpF family gas vesicle protein [Streptomyces]|uniref:GvpL/GvpF family gas vesicle protein n=1 Tax=Streptomyces lycii TaxID=2654337 RepID=A0ABQ7FEC4_9ACTN|nr:MULTISPECIES: GvpL/GvpF family gas vesicle protein [Streptomyces]KAF4407175.1 GvpL/GvpF family gas vesicle protein [Streptomyces lycii]PGH51132.1 gas vesicle protein [Streptomyces sp. Ru87]